MPPPKPAGRPSLKVKAGAVSSKQKQNKRNIQVLKTGVKRNRSPDTLPAPKKIKTSVSPSALIKHRLSGTPNELKKKLPQGTSAKPKKLHALNSSVKSKKQQTSNSRTTSKQFNTPTRLKKNPAGRQKQVKTNNKSTVLKSSSEKTKQKGKKEKSFGVTAGHVKIVKRKNIPLEPSSGKKKVQKVHQKTVKFVSKKNIKLKAPVTKLKSKKTVQKTPQKTVKLVSKNNIKLQTPVTVQKTPQKTVKLVSKKNIKLQTPVTKLKSKVSKTKTSSLQKYHVNLEATLAHLPLLKAKSPLRKQKPISRKNLTILKESRNKKTGNVSRSKAAVKKTQQILTLKTKTNKTIQNKTQIVKDITPLIPESQILLKCSTNNIKIPLGLERIDNSNFWQPSIVLRKIQDIMLGEMFKITAEETTTGVFTIYKEPSVSEKSVPKEKNETTVHHQTSKRKRNLCNTLDKTQEPSHDVNQCLSEHENVQHQNCLVLETNTSVEENIVLSPENRLQPKIPRRTSISVSSVTPEQQFLKTTQNNTVPEKVANKTKSLKERPKEERRGVKRKTQDDSFERPVSEEFKTATIGNSSLMLRSKTDQNKNTSSLKLRKTGRIGEKLLQSNVNEDNKDKLSIVNDLNDIPKRKRGRPKLSIAVSPNDISKRKEESPKLTNDLSHQTEVPSMEKEKHINISEYQNFAVKTPDVVNVEPKPKKKDNVKPVVHPKTKRLIKTNPKQNETMTVEVNKKTEVTQVTKSLASITSPEHNAIENLSLDSVHSHVSEVVGSDSVEERLEESNISDQLLMLDPKFIEEANLTEIMNSDVSCDNMSWSSLNTISNQKKALKLQKELIILQKNMNLLKDAAAKREELLKEVGKKIKDLFTNKGSSL